MKRVVLLSLLASIPVFGQNAKRGKQLYENSTCHACHGDSGDGKGEVALTSRPTLNPLPSSFKGRLKHGNDLESIIRNIQNGIPGTKMIAYKGILRDDEIADLARYIQSFQRNKTGSD